jgi:hypothetical protein
MEQGVQKVFVFDYSSTFHHPTNNFSYGNYKGEGTEHEFGGLFSRNYSEKFTNIHAVSTRNHLIAVRELPINGSGIVDLVVVNTDDPFNVLGNAIIRSFEFKLNNWRTGLMQAHRYKNFSNVSILVMPVQRMRAAEQRLDLFRELGVGLWGFSIDTKTIIRKFTPRPLKIPNKKRVAELLNKIRESSDHS